MFWCSVAPSCPTHGLQHTRLPCPSPSPGACSNSCPLSRDAIQPSHPLSPSSPPALNLSKHNVFSNEPALCLRWPKYWIFSISPSNEYSGLISFRINWCDLLAVQGFSRVFSNIIVQKHQFFVAQQSLWSNSHICTATGKTIALPKWTFVDKVMALLFNILSRLVIAFLPRSNHLLISWLQSPSAVILEPTKIKSVTVSTFFPSICQEVMGPDATI